MDDKDEVEDHTALETVLEWSSPQYTQYQWSWKETDPDQAAQEGQGLHIPFQLSSRDEVESYAGYLL